MKFDLSGSETLSPRRSKKRVNYREIEEGTAGGADMDFPPMPALSSSPTNGHGKNVSKSKRRKLTNSNSSTTECIAPPKNASAHTNKYNLKYDPDEDMTEEQKAEWRKEQRKARNRASAAASRQKTKVRIDELEAEVDELRALYARAVERIAELEGAGLGIPSPLASVPTNTSTPAHRSTSTNTIVSPPTSPPLSPVQAVHLEELPPLDQDRTTTTVVDETVKITGAASTTHLSDNECDRQDHQSTAEEVAAILPSLDHPSTTHPEVDYEPLIDFHGRSDVMYDNIGSSSEEDGCSSSSSPELSSAPSSTTDDSDSEMEEFLLDAFDGFNPKEALEMHSADDVARAVCV